MGSYDFAKIKSMLSKACPRVDAAHFTSNVEIKQSQG